MNTVSVVNMCENGNVYVTSVLYIIHQWNK